MFYSEGGEKIVRKFADVVESAIAKIGSDPHRFERSKSAFDAVE